MMIFLTSLKSIFGIIFIIGLGYILRKRNWFHDSFSANISKLITNIALPASIFYSVLKYLELRELIKLSDRLLYTFASVILGYIIAFLMVKIFKIRNGRRGTFINAVVNANTIFIGMPLNIALFGEESMPYYLMYYITNTVSIWTLGAFCVANDPIFNIENENKGKSEFDWKKLLSPPLIGFMTALLFLLFRIKVPDFISSTLNYIGSIVTPLSLMYIGIVLADAGLHSIHFDRDTVLALICRFIFSPVIMMSMIMIGNAVSGEFTELDVKTYMIQSSAPVFAVLPILVHEARGDVKYATNVVTTSTILFAAVIPIILSII